MSIFLSQPTTTAPAPGAAPAPAPAQPSQGAPSAPAADGGPFGGLMPILFLLPLLFVFLMTRNQNKKQKEIESSLKPGDTVVTQSGLIGKIIDLGERRAKLEIAPGVNVQVLKASIQGIEGDGKAAEAKDKTHEKKA